jgi:hypothetical protein
VINAAKDPQAGTDPSAEGPVGSGFVAMNFAPRSMSRIARVMFSKEWVLVSPSQSHVPNHERAAASHLIDEKLCSRQGRCPDGLLGDVDATQSEPRSQITRGVDGIVGQYQEAASVLLQGGDELGSARQRLLLVYQYAIHVGEPRFDRLGIGHARHSSV